MKKSSLNSIQEYQDHFVEFTQKDVLTYFEHGSGEQTTLRANENDFHAIKIMPRVLIDVSKVELSTSILGYPSTVPFGISPTAFHKLLHEGGELATAKAANKFGCPMILSSFSNVSLEEISRSYEASKQNLWFQLHFCKNRSILEDLIKRVESSGYKALVVTVDTPIHPEREAIKRYKMELPSHLELINFRNYDFFRRSKNDASELFNASVTWQDIKWIKSFSKLPIVLKGIINKEDALEAIQLGVNGIIISNHGGRQIDGVPSTIRMAKEIIDVVTEIKSSCEIYIDGGFRKGSDVFKALAIGVKFVFLGRPVLWGLKYDGENGVGQILQMFATELEQTMKLSGCINLNDIKRSHVLYPKLWEY